MWCPARTQLAIAQHDWMEGALIEQRCPAQWTRSPFQVSRRPIEDNYDPGDSEGTLVFQDIVATYTDCVPSINSKLWFHLSACFSRWTAMWPAHVTLDFLFLWTEKVGKQFEMQHKPSNCCNMGPKVHIKVIVHIFRRGWNNWWGSRWSLETHTVSDTGAGDTLLHNFTPVSYISEDWKYFPSNHWMWSLCSTERVLVSPLNYVLILSLIGRRDKLELGK